MQLFGNGKIFVVVNHHDIKKTKSNESFYTVKLNIITHHELDLRHK